MELDASRARRRSSRSLRARCRRALDRQGRGSCARSPQPDRPALPGRLPPARPVSLELDDVYSGAKSWSDLCAENAGLARPAQGSARGVAAPRRADACLHVDDTVAHRGVAPLRRRRRSAPGVVPASTRRERRLARMLVAQLATRPLQKSRRPSTKPAPRSASTRRSAASWWSCWRCCRGAHRSRAGRPSTRHPDVPLAVHARYTRDRDPRGLRRR